MIVGKFKVWSRQFLLMSRHLWPLLIYDVSTSEVDAIER